MSIRVQPWIPTVALMVSGLAGPLPGCGGDQSLGAGLPVADAAVLDAPNMPDEGGICSSHEGIDAEASLTEGLLAWYRCELTAGSSLVDSSSHGNDATLVTGTGEAQAYSFAAGKVGDALYLTPAEKGYVSLPQGLLADACEVTIATWVYVNSNVNAWMRIWDFGQGTKTYMFLTTITNTDDVARFAISVSGNTNEETIKAASAVPTLKWTHVALVLGAAGGALYFDGSPVGTNTSMKLRPADLGVTVNNYVGRSEFSQDPYLDGDIDEFRIYNRALSPEEIRALANGS
jgi:hypothetical protein